MFEREPCYLYLELDLPQILPQKQEEKQEEERVIVIDIMGDSDEIE